MLMNPLAAAVSHERLGVSRVPGLGLPSPAYLARVAWRRLTRPSGPPDGELGRRGAPAKRGRSLHLLHSRIPKDLGPSSNSAFIMAESSSGMSVSPVSPTMVSLSCTIRPSNDPHQFAAEPVDDFPALPCGRSGGN